MLSALGSFAAGFSDIASYFTVPTLGGLYNTATGIKGFISKVTDIFSIGMPVYPDRYEESGGNEIGTQVLVGGMDSSLAMSQEVGALTKIMDNVVVNPRTWKIHGYIGVNVENSTGAGFLSSSSVLGPLTSFVNSFGRDSLNLAIRKYIKYVSDSRRPFKFTTADGETIPCLIQSYVLKEEPENLNWVDVDLVLQEFLFVGLTSNGQNVVIGGDPWGSVGNTVKSLAKSALKTIGLKIT